MLQCVNEQNVAEAGMLARSTGSNPIRSPDRQLTRAPITEMPSLDIVVTVIVICLLPKHDGLL